MGKHMRAWVFYEPEKMRLEEVPLPETGPGDLLVKVGAVGICGSDVSYYFGHSPLGTPDGRGPLVLGHEISGVVAGVGAAARNLFQSGDRVTVNPVQQCNACPACADGRFNICPNADTIGVSVNGGFAEYVKVRHTHAMKLDDGVSLEAACLTEPLACSVYAMRKLDLRLGDTVAVIGSGSIGLMMVQLAKARGAGKVVFIGTRDVPLEVGAELGADFLINSKDSSSPHYHDNVKDAVVRLLGRQVDGVVVPTSAPAALQQALDISAPYSTIVYFGLPGPKDMIQVPALDTIQADKTIKFSWLAPLVWPETLALLAAGKVDVASLSSHKYTFEGIEKGIQDMAAGLADKIKGMVIL